MELSIRLQAVADLVSEGMVVADIGTDHGYIPIYLVENGKSPKAFAMDVNKGPLLRARDHIQEHGLLDKIETRQSDGAKNLTCGECDAIVIAGMGGGLTIRILEEGKAIFKNLKEFVLQPQSELSKVRGYLVQQGYCIVQENMVLDAGKFYPMMKVMNENSAPYNEVELCYGKLLLESKHPVLQSFLEKEVCTKHNILEALEREEGLHIEVRKNEIKKELEGIQYALQRYYESN